MGKARCGPHGLRPVSQSSHVLLMEQSRPASLGNRQPGPGCGLGKIPAPILLPPISPPATGPRQVQEAGCQANAAGSSMVAREVVLPSTAGDDSRLSPYSSEQQDGGGLDFRSTSPRPEETEASRLLDFWEVRTESLNLSESSKKLVEASWRKSTEQRYAGAWSKWLSWCSVHKVQPASPPLSQVINYLSSLFDEGLQYRTINLHCSALSEANRWLLSWSASSCLPSP